MKWFLVDEESKEILGQYPSVLPAQKDNDLFFGGKAHIVLNVKLAKHLGGAQP